MKKIIFILIGILISVNLFSQTSKFEEIKTNKISAKNNGVINILDTIKLKSLDKLWKLELVGDTLFINNDTLISSASSIDTTSIYNAINSKVGGSITSAQIGFGSATDTLTSSANLTWNNTTKTQTIIGGGTIGNTTILDLKNGASPTPISKFKVLDNGVIDGTFAKIGASGSVILGQAGNGSLTGVDNIMIGRGAGASITTGSNSLLIGLSAGMSLTTGTDNVFIGSGSGRKVTTKSLNTAVGVESMNSATNAETTGDGNSCFGNRSGYKITSGGYNCLFGYRAGHGITTANYNVYIGIDAGYNTVDGWGNIALGLNSGFYNVSGINNVFIGYNAGFYETGSNKLYISNSEVSTPLIYGEFDTKILTINNILKIAPITGVVADTITGVNGMIIYVSDNTSVTFTSAGFWKYQEGHWSLL